MNKRIFQIENMSAEDFLKHFTDFKSTLKDLIPAYRIGGKVRYKKSEVLQALNQMNNFKNK